MFIYFVWVGIDMIINWLIFFVVILITLACLLEVVKSKVLYYPSREPIYAPAEILEQTGGSMTHQDVYLHDGLVKLHGWFVQQNTTGLHHTILLSHGNGSNLSGRSDLIQTLLHLGLNICIYDYPGYGQSTGNPSERGFYQSGEVFMDYLIHQKEIPVTQIIPMGESIGCAVAAYLAQKYHTSKLILLSGFSSIKEMFYGLLPTYLSPLKILGFLLTEFPTDQYLTQFQGQTLLLHSQDDEIVPFKHALSNSQIKGCQLLKIGGTHNQPVFESAVLETIRLFTGEDIHGSQTPP